MKKRILIVVLFLFILTLCGTAYAEDIGDDTGVIINSSSGSTNNRNYPSNELNEVSITGQVLDCDTGEPFSGVNMTASYNGSQLATAQTDNQGMYLLHFFSNFTQFNVTASYPGHKSSFQMVNISGNNTTLQANTDFQLGKPRVLFIVNSVKASFIDAVIACDYLDVTVFAGKNLPETINVDDYDLIFVDWLSSGLSYCTRVVTLMQEAVANNISVIMTKTWYLDIPGEVIIADGNAPYQYVRDYWSNMNNINAKELLKFIGVKFFALELGQPQAAVLLKSEAIYHPDASAIFESLEDYYAWYNYNPSNPTVAILFIETEFKNGDLLVVNALIRAFENKGYNVIPYFYPNNGRPNIAKYLMQEGKSMVDLIIHYKMLGWSSNSTTEDIQSDLQTLNVPVLKAYKYFADYNSWLNGTQGMQSESIGATIVPSEMDGMFDPIIIATQELDPAYSAFGVTVYKPIERQINWLVNTAISWINLRYEENTDKKIAIIYWHGVGKDKGASAGHLDVYASIANLLNALKNEGYDLGNGSLPNSEDLVEIIRNQGYNIGVWAPTELIAMVTNYPVILIPENEYLAWFNQLNAAKRQEVIDMWGEPPGDIMVYLKDGIRYLVLPAIKYGNVILAPEPSRGYAQDDDALYHSSSIPPTHQYLAFYFWLKQDFGADAIIDLGRHGSLAWLPGKSGPGLDIENCWPAIVSQDIPVIYPFTVEGSEGLLPKRRQGSVMISHLIPSMTISELYGELAVLKSKINDYNAPNIDADAKLALKNSILTMVSDLKINEDIGIVMTSINGANFDEFLGKLHEYLEDIESEFIPYGLHVLGAAPTGEELTNLVQTILGYEFRDYVVNNNLNNTMVQALLNQVLINGKSPEQAQILVLGSVDSAMTSYLLRALDYATIINNCPNEITSIINALNGTYIPPGMSGDPVTNPDVLPTGTNFYSFDPRKVPTDEATIIGNKMAQDILNRYLQETGKYPEKISFMLWSCHTQQDMGVMEAAIFYLLGVERVFDTNNQEMVVDVKLIETLGRPRIDVVITTTSLYISMYRSRLDLINKAVLLAANANDTLPNYVKRNSEAIYNALKAKGFSDEDARKLSVCRIFSQEEGNHNNAMQNALLITSSWENEGQLAETFIDTFGNVFMGSEINSIHMEDLYSLNLNGTEVAMFRRVVNVNDLFGDSDYFGYFGGMGLAIKHISGQEPKMWIMNVENPSNPKLESLSESLWRDVRSTYYNSKYIEKIKSYGATGAGIFADFVRYISAWKITSPDSVNDNMFQQAYEVYFQDKYDLGMNGWFDKNNPYAQQAMAAILLDAIRRGDWKADMDVVNDLANRMAQNIIKNGIACCDCTCANLANMKWASKYLNADILTQFNQQIFKTTMNSGFTPSQSVSQSQPSQAQGGGTNYQVASESSVSDGGVGEQSPDKSASPGEEGESKAYEVSQQSTSSSTSESGLPLAAIAGVIALVCLVGLGYYRGSFKGK
ncbi:MAG: cobaltochelatase subunit CobN [Methanobacterium sp.]|nr:cobaltochelatase subunit CobN [Methanobacterium sp.]